MIGTLAGGGEERKTVTLDAVSDPTITHTTGAHPMFLIVAPLLWLAALAGAPPPGASYHPYTSDTRQMAANGNNKGAAAHPIQSTSPEPQLLWWQPAR